MLLKVVKSINKVTFQRPKIKEINLEFRELHFERIKLTVYYKCS